ncbi:hypothetical protein BHE97_12475 [Aeromicrobium sp. PE09-221]|uniref:hypothetical protein n=1 Tax=Aeromicrobium sp. PE09-221 TaxID=1898043 RepID=UPI000B3E933E|nr:hypothetical protein [Aeromicrobium sp. PE09-221]OUZ08935.1 hypothetical protein BHE97_12475 [Aeromicrobium sp. PE09-221]
MSSLPPSQHFPLWCEKAHAPDDPPEARYHEQILADFAAIVGTQDDMEHPPVPDADGLIVRRIRHFDSPSTWIAIEPAETGKNGLLVHEDAAILLHDALSAVTRELG